MAILINGNLNDPVYASQDSDLLAAIVGNTTCITQVGYQFAHELEDANTVMVKDGVIITKEGRRIQLDAGDVDEFLIPTGTQGVTAYYICGYHLYTDGESAELCETFVTLMGSSSETIPENTFRAGATEVYVSLLRVTQSGVNISAVTNLLPSSNTIKQIMTSISSINTSLTDLSNNKLNKSGGSMSGDINFNTDGTETSKIKFKNSTSSAFIDIINSMSRWYLYSGNFATKLNSLELKETGLAMAADKKYMIGGKDILYPIKNMILRGFNSATLSTSFVQVGNEFKFTTGGYVLFIFMLTVNKADEFEFKLIDYDNSDQIIFDAFFKNTSTGYGTFQFTAVKTLTANHRYLPMMKRLGSNGAIVVDTNSSYLQAIPLFIA